MDFLHDPHLARFIHPVDGEDNRASCHPEMHHSPRFQLDNDEHEHCAEKENVLLHLFKQFLQVSIVIRRTFTHRQHIYCMVNFGDCIHNAPLYHLNILGPT